MGQALGDILPPLPEDQEYVLYVMSSDRTALAASTRVPLDQTRYQNDGTADFYLTEIGMEETVSGALHDCALELKDIKANRNVFRNQTSFSTLGIVDAVTPAATRVGAHYKLDKAYRIGPSGSFAPLVENLNASSARTVRVTLIGYQALKKGVERAT